MLGMDSLGVLAMLDRSSWVGAELSGANLSGAQLGDANFSGAFFGPANFSGAWLVGANFSGVNLVEANLAAWCCTASRAARSTGTCGSPIRAPLNRGEGTMNETTKVFGEHDEKTLEQFHDVASRSVRAALMADGHFGYVMPIGGVAAYRNQVSPIGVGVDIACGNAAIRTDLMYEDVLDHLPVYADEIAGTIAFGPGQTNPSEDAPKDDPLFEDGAWTVVPRSHRGNLIGKARAQLGTTGGGNHYVDVFADEEDRIWVGVHFGSRGLGFKLAHSFVALAQGLEWDDRPDMNSEVLLDLDTPLGADYWTAMSLAGQYAYAGREWVARKVVEILGGTEQELVHNHHNFAWKEVHFAEELVVVRKGATPAEPGQKGFVGGSMGDDSVILRGAFTGAFRHPEQEASLYSTVHGAGRVMGRIEAKGKWKKGRLVRPGKIDHEMMDEWMDGKGVELRGGDLDEAPQAYRRLDDVLAAQGDTVDILHTLRPLIVCMAPSRTSRPAQEEGQ